MVYKYPPLAAENGVEKKEKPSETLANFL